MLHGSVRPELELNTTYWYIVESLFICFWNFFNHQN